MKNINYPPIKNNFTDANEIDLGAFINILIRGRYLILSLTSIITIFVVLYTYIAKPIYKGSFQIVVKKDQNLTPQTSVLSNLSNVPDLSLGLITNKTQEVILKSKSVLKPVYEYNLQHNRKEINKNYYVSYSKWFSDSIEIGFEKGTNVLKVQYKNTDKKFILDILNKISLKYQDYSKSEREKELTNTINYLTQQQAIFKVKADNSFQELNNFTINNGLGNIDGFVTLDNLPPSYDFKSKGDEKVSLDINPSKELRFEDQFILLSSYETEYAALSAKLKPNSKVLKVLETKILSLRDSLKRPNEILTKYRGLLKNASRDESYLNNIEQLLELNKFEKAKQNMPWDLISTPTINDARVFPKRSKITIFTFLLSLSLASLLAIFLERKSGVIFEEEEIKNKLNIKFLDKIYAESNLKIKIINKYFKEKNNNSINESTKNSYLVNINENQTKIGSSPEKEFFNLNLYDNEDKLKQSNGIILLIEPGKITNDDIIYLNQFANIYEDKILGWMSINRKLKLNI